MNASEFITPVIKRALAGIEEVPADERADLYEGVAILIEPHMAMEAEAARKTANSIREAEQQQLTLISLFKD